MAVFTGCTPAGPKALLDGERLITRGKYSEAQERLEKAVKALPENPQAWNHLGLSYHYGGQAKRAAQCYAKAAALDRNLVAARYNFGCLELEEKNYATAVDSFTTVVSLQPNRAEAWNRLGLAQLGQAAQANGAEKNRLLDLSKKSFDAGLRLSHSAEALNGQGMVQAMRNRPRDALAYFNSAVQQQSDYAPALLNLAVVHQQMLNDKGVALQRYKEYLANVPQSTVSPTVSSIVRQIDAELHPAPVRPTNAVAVQNATLGPTNALLTNALVRLGPTNMIRSDSNATRIAKNVPTNNPARLPVVGPTNREPPVEVTRVTPEPVIKPARDVSSGPPVMVATNDAEPFTVLSPRETSNRRKPNILQRMNPTTWFSRKPRNDRADAAPATLPREIEATPFPEPSRETVTNVGTRSAVTELPPRPALPRYRYRSPRAPVSGNRPAAQPFFDEGVKAQREGRSREAVAAYEQALRRDPAFTEAHYNLGLAAFQSGDLPTSLAAYEYALALSPRQLNIRYNFALALQKANYPLDAANELEGVLRDYPGETRAHLTLANLYAQQLLDNGKARDHYLRVIQLEPQHIEALNIRYWLAAHR